MHASAASSNQPGHTCVFGLQWGDEGKGKLVDVLVADHDVVVRYAGGPNAGHTIVVDGQKIALHQIPSGILRENILNVMASGMVIDPAILLTEMNRLREQGISFENRLAISDRAHLILPYHRREDALAESQTDPTRRVGTTARGIGPCYADKARRHHAVRLCDLRDADRFRAHLRDIVAFKSSMFRAVYEDREMLDADVIADEYLTMFAELTPFVTDATELLHASTAAGKQLLFEGAQGALLDIDHGTYPFVTSASAGVGGVASGSGVPTNNLARVVGVMKAYSTRVGSGPLPTELPDGAGDELREKGHEYGTTTGRPRRCGWFDCVAARYAAQVMGPTELALMHLDTLSGFPELPIAVGYRIDGRETNSFPADAYLGARLEPVYETLPGWEQDLQRCRSVEELPDAARRFVDRIAERVHVPIRTISVGPDRAQTISNL